MHAFSEALLETPLPNTVCQISLSAFHLKSYTSPAQVVITGGRTWIQGKLHRPTAFLLRQRRQE